MFLTTRVSEHDSCNVVAIDGELDMSTAEQLRDTLTTTIESNEFPLVLDLVGLSFCDSAGLAVFVRAHNQLDDKGRKLVVARPTAAVSRILSLSGLAQVIPTATDPDEGRAMATTA